LERKKTEAQYLGWRGHVVAPSFLMWRKTFLIHRGEMACSVGDPGQCHTGQL
jgi:hypothetical protein